MRQSPDNCRRLHRGFTLVEVIVVVIVIGILASIAMPKYLRTVERSRCAEARKALGVIRDMELVYFVENNLYTGNMADLNLTYPAACNADYYFRYSIPVGNAAGFTARADRCTASGKDPQGPAAGYNLMINQAGTMSGTPAYL